MRERDAAIIERDMLRSELRRSERPCRTHWVRHRPLEETVGTIGVSGPVQSGIDDGALIRRVIAAYQEARPTALGDPGSFWLTEFARIKQADHEILYRGDEAAITRLLRNPAESRLFVGFDELHDHSEMAEHGISKVISTPGWLCDGLVRMAEAIGTTRLAYPERLEPGTILLEVEELLVGLDRAAGFRITFPNPFPGEIGLATSRGVASFRAIQSLYQAWRISELVAGRPDARVVEIGAGLGRTAFYARQFGILDYTIIDLPLTNVAQGYFLGRLMGPDVVGLFGEGRAPVRILPPTAFLEATDRYDLAVNIDSLTEMAADTARTYCRTIFARAKMFLSINHEFNPFTVRELCEGLSIRPATRMPYWLRRGYVDEVFSP